MRTLILTVAALGFVVCSGVLLLSWLAPLQVERWAREAIEHEVRRKVGARWQSLQKPALVRAAEQAMRQNAEKIEAAQVALVRLVVREMQDPDCPCRRKLREWQRASREEQIERMTTLNDRLRHLAETKYAEVSSSLLRELRIFAGANAVVFGLLGIVAWVRKRATVQLLAPTLVLLGAATLVACCYLFSQNWLQTILLSDYVGWAYVPWLGVAVAALADVVWNRARICTQLVNAAAQVMGAAFSAVPC